LLFLIIGTAVFLLNFLSSLFLLYIAAGIIGFCFGGFLSVYPAMTCDYFGVENFGINYGLVFIGYGMGCFTGPWLGGVVHDATGNYLIAFITAGIMAFLGGIIAFFRLKKTVHRGK
jgi:MFS transporter, OFA family, oxalate/formate antiporter